MDEWLKLPGLFYRHELEQVIELVTAASAPAHEYVFGLAGRDDRGRALVAVYRREHARAPGSPLLDAKGSDNGRPEPPVAAAVSTAATTRG